METGMNTERTMAKKSTVTEQIMKSNSKTTKNGIRISDQQQIFQHIYLKVVFPPVICKIN